MIHHTVDLQDLLGAHQDSVIAVARFRTLVAEEGANLPPATVFAMGEIAQRYMGQAAELRQRFPKVFGRLAGKAWVDVHRVMKRQA